MFKFLKFIAITMSCLLFYSCNNATVLFESRAIFDMTIIAGTNPILTSYHDVLVPINYDEIVERQTIDETTIKEVVPSIATFQSRSQEENFGFLESIIIEVLHPDDIEDVTEVFYFDPIPPNERSPLTLAPSLPDIKRYIRNGELWVRLKYRVRSPSPRNFDVRVDMAFSALELE